jgi:hypothetical protein
MVSGSGTPSTDQKIIGTLMKYRRRIAKIESVQPLALTPGV